MRFETPNGALNVAFDELALFFNNATTTYGYELLSEGMTKNEALEALEAGGFAPELAEAFLKTMGPQSRMAIAWENKRLVKTR